MILRERGDVDDLGEQGCWGAGILWTDVTGPGTHAGGRGWGAAASPDPGGRVAAGSGQEGLFV